MKWMKFKIKTVTEAEDIIISEPNTLEVSQIEVVEQMELVF